MRQKHFFPKLTGVTPERLLILQDVYCALIALFTMLTFDTIRLTKIHIHTCHLNCNRIFSVNVLYRMICILRQITAHLIVHSVAYIFKRDTVIPNGSVECSYNGFLYFQ